ncbi:hypothetical protein CAL7716_053100 [Calothrix sp. PCC 7716]|nr:hypothetical protein CAL7716_053100 [Calothrix sp. PCC 7716]
MSIYIHVCLFLSLYVTLVVNVVKQSDYSMSDDWHLTIYSRKKQMVLGILVNRIVKTSPEWAAQYRRNIFAHEILPNAPYLLFVFPDKLYLWRKSEITTEETLPNYNIDAHPIFQPYFQRSKVTPEKIRSQSLELIVISWLADIMYSESPSSLSKSQKWVVESRLFTAISQGKFAIEQVA